MIACPTNVEEICDIIGSSAKVMPHGSRTKDGLVSTTAATEVTYIDMRGISGIVTYDPSEFLITAKAGTTVAEVADALAKNGQYLPFDPVWCSRGATLGGTVAAGLSGPSRVLYGSIRDFIVEIAMVDGLARQVRGGGKVVKNAAGFDFPKMMVGSYGRMGLLTEITMKVFPRPQAFLTLLWDAPNLAACIAAVSRILSQPLQIAAIEIDPPDSMIIRIAGPQDALANMADRVDGLIGSPASRVMNPVTEQRIWADRSELGWVDDGQAIAKIATTMQHIEPLLQSLPAIDCVRGMISSCAGTVMWVALDLAQTTRPLDHLLKQLNLSAVVVSGQVRDLTLLGNREWVRFATRIQRAIDPAAKFASFAADEIVGEER